MLVPKKFFNKIYKIRVDTYAVIISCVIYRLQSNQVRRTWNIPSKTVCSSVLLYIVIKKLYQTLNYLIIVRKERIFIYLDNTSSNKLVMV